MNNPQAQLEMRDAVRSVLLQYWDPNDVISHPEAHRTYDVFIDPLLELIRSGADEEAVIGFLKAREAETMCFPGLGTERLRPAARHLLSLRA